MAHLSKPPFCCAYVVDLLSAIEKADLEYLKAVRQTSVYLKCDPDSE